MESSLENIMDCKLNNAIFKTTLKGPWVYNLKSKNSETGEYEYFFVVSSLNLETFESLVEEIIVKSLGY